MDFRLRRKHGGESPAPDGYDACGVTSPGFWNPTAKCFVHKAAGRDETQKQACPP